MHAAAAAILLFDRAKKRKVSQQYLKENIKFLDTIPKEILKNSFESSKHFKSFVLQTDKYADASFSVARQFIDDISSKVRRHHDIHCISFTESIHGLIGYSLEEFANLLDFLKPHLEKAYPNCELILLPGEVRNYCSIRMKLFLTMFRLKQACPFRVMEKVFGWGRASISDWFITVVKVIFVNMKIFHVGFLSWMGKRWQEKELLAWRISHLVKDDLPSFIERIKEQNEAAVSKGHQRVFDVYENTDRPKFSGSLGTHFTCLIITITRSGVYFEKEQLMELLA